MFNFLLSNTVYNTDKCVRFSPFVCCSLWVTDLVSLLNVKSLSIILPTELKPTITNVKKCFLGEGFHLYHCAIVFVMIKIKLFCVTFE